MRRYEIQDDNNVSRMACIRLLGGSRAQSSSRGMGFALGIEWCPENVEGILSGCCRDILVTEDGCKPSPSRPCGLFCEELSARGARKCPGLTCVEK